MAARKRKAAAVPVTLSERSRGVRAAYDAARTTPDNAMHWSLASGASADAEANRGVRDILRRRARYECQNNSYAIGMLRTLAADCVGRQPILQLITEDKDFARRAESAFWTWEKAVGLGVMMRTARMCRARDGEAFVRLVSNPGLAGPVTLDLQLIEADRVTDDWAMPTLRRRDGIEYDRYGNPARYRVLRYHPGSDEAGANSQQYDWIPAAEMCHYYVSERPGQRRGVPEITPALPLFAQLRRYTLAVLHAAETAADYAAVMQTTNLPDEPTSYVPLDTIQLEPNMMTTLPEGWTLGQMDAKQPTATYEAFKREVLSEIARCLSIPYNVAAASSAGYNFSSGKLDHLVYHKSVRIERTVMEDAILDRVARAWLREWTLVAGLPPPDDLSWQWGWDGIEAIDPNKEISAARDRIVTGLSTYQIEAARLGEDYEELFAQQARETKMRQSLGLPIMQQTGAPSAPQANQEE